MPNNFVFIRTKFIKGNPYAYLVENTWKKQSSRQKVSKYLGRIYPITETPPPQISENILPQEIVSELIKQETASFTDITINTKNKTVRKENKPVVISLNGGYLCDVTLKDLHKALFVRNEERAGTALAEAMARAGLRIPQHAFIKLYTYYARKTA